MGRSQVKYNKTHGRPGTKGRGGGGRGRGTSLYRQQQEPQGDNAWRYESATTRTESPNFGINMEMLDLETRKQYYSSSKTVTVEEDTFVGGKNRIDISKMGKALDRLSVAERLSIPAYLTVDLEVRESKKGDADLSTSSARDMESKQAFTNVESAADGAIKDSSEETKTERDEDDLDTWLDTVIT